MKRRQFISLAGGGVVMAAAAGAAAFLTTRDPVRVRAPWDEAGAVRFGDPRLHALSYAILAPNPHNRQAWIADVREPGRVTLLADLDRLLPVTDPFNRQITIGLGCFLELLTLAASETGHRIHLDLFPEGENLRNLTQGRIAVAHFIKDSAVRTDPLFSQILTRRSNKEPFDTKRPLESEVVRHLAKSARFGASVDASVSDESIQALRDITVRALRIELETPRTYRESVDLFRIGKRAIEANPDGIDLPGPAIETLAAIGQFDKKQLLDQTSLAYREGAKAVLANARTAMGHIWLVTQANDRHSQILAGRDWVRLNLAATRDGLGFQPLSQALQEYPEMAELYRQVHDKLAPGGGTVQMLCRLGYGPSVAASPRWPLETRLVRA